MIHNLLKILSFMLDICSRLCDKDIHGIADKKIIVIKESQLKGAHYGTVPADKNHANLLITFRNFLVLFQ
jgi:hypothetical protein